jgi:hypothetical protein
VPSLPYPSIRSDFDILHCCACFFSIFLVREKIEIVISSSLVIAYQLITEQNNYFHVGVFDFLFNNKYYRGLC